MFWVYDAVRLRLPVGMENVHEALVPHSADQLLKEYPEAGVAVMATEVPAT